MMHHLHVTNFGPIHDGTVEFGDLTVLVGQQATGKSLLLQASFRARVEGASRLQTWRLSPAHGLLPSPRHPNLWVTQAGSGSFPIA